MNFDINQALVIYSGFIKYYRKLGIDSVPDNYRKVLIGAIPLCYTIIIKCNVYWSVHRKNIPIYIQQDAMLHSLLYLETAPYFSGGTSTHHQEYIQLYLQHLVFVTPLLLSAVIMEEFPSPSAACSVASGPPSVVCGVCLFYQGHWTTRKP